ncbi:MAG: NUDIX domain-containing protein [Pseudomonadota bacterium]
MRIAAAIIRDSVGRTLLVRKSGTDVFMQAGGKIEVNETARDALVREVSEELGADIVNAEYTGTYAAPAANEPDHRVIAEVFICVLDAQPVPAAEIAEMIWFDPEHSPDLKIAPLSRLLMKEVVC